MDKEEFLASGLIEQYALGLTSEEETRLVEHFVENYPEIRAKMNELQQAVEQYAAKYAVPPPRRLKQRILSEIQAQDEEEGAFDKDHPFAFKPPAVQRVPSRVPSISFVAMLLISFVSIGLLLWRQQQLQEDNRILQSELNTYRSENDHLQEEQSLFKKLFDFIENGNTYVVHLKGTELAPDAHAVVYWNPNTQKSYVKLIKMPTLPSQQQFQLWADVQGEMLNAGLLDRNYSELQEVNFIQSAESLNITVEPVGGSPKPTVRLLVANAPLEPSSD